MITGPHGPFSLLCHLNDFRLVPIQQVPSLTRALAPSYTCSLECSPIFICSLLTQKAIDNKGAKFSFKRIMAYVPCSYVQSFQRSMIDDRLVFSLMYMVCVCMCVRVCMHGFSLFLLIVSPFIACILAF